MARNGGPWPGAAWDGSQFDPFGFRRRERPAPVPAEASIPVRAPAPFRSIPGQSSAQRPGGLPVSRSAPGAPMNPFLRRPAPNLQVERAARDFDRESASDAASPDRGSPFQAARAWSAEERERDESRSEREPRESTEVDEPAEERAETDGKEELRLALQDLASAESRVERNAERVYEETRAKLVSDLFPVLDNLDRTVRAAAGSANTALVEGVEMVRNQLEEVLQRYGAERIASAGEKFDPAVHHAIAMVPSDPARVGLVVNEVEAGYRFAGKVLRPAKVIVGAA